MHPIYYLLFLKRIFNSFQKYFPNKMKEKIYYKPSKSGFEKEIKKRLDWWKKLKEEQENSS
ncbi:MAG: hypothetical protein KAT66_05425 [Candidatus Lokiarchaeota archaeon]|nr:hypothetical protein [Candidatus Lokiarchaeota archaeon]